MTAEEVRTQWLTQQPQYEAFGDISVSYLKGICERAGVWRRISYRVKSIDSVVKKFLKTQRDNGNFTLKSMTDKLGLRVVVRFPREVNAVVETIPEAFIVTKIERKSERLDPDRFGYQSTHLDVMLKPDHPEIGALGDLTAEIQVRTLAQDLWSEMAHDLSYKGVLRLAGAEQRLIDRRIYILSALVESADMDFSRIDDELHGVPNASELLVLAALEKHYYRFTAQDYDREFSIDSIRTLMGLYGGNALSQISSAISHFVTTHEKTLQHVFERQRINLDRSVFLYQPESLIILERLTNAPLALENFWPNEFPPEELARLKNVWAVPD